MDIRGLLSRLMCYIRIHHGIGVRIALNIFTVKTYFVFFFQNEYSGLTLQTLYPFSRNIFSFPVINLQAKSLLNNTITLSNK